MSEPTVEEIPLESHERWLRVVAERLFKQQRDYSIANTCEEAADAIRDALTRLRDVQRELEECKRDAERFAWYADQCSPSAADCHWRYRGDQPLVGDSFREAIDAQLSKEQQP